ncbi:protein TolA [Bradyrhizobium sp. WD16]|uniref:protein TolA n=1 Tax=Bradyrhizobium sp. WD16 TaxID=1521768 RepID=UPI0020A5B19D|nr:protein TolA [Bradyrhizobium sp. WD16]UTD27273.1 protein TolA [Bradyrhizobium sp. WD16]
MEAGRLREIWARLDKTLVASVALHVVALGWCIFSFAPPRLEATPPDTIAVDVISADQLAKLSAGTKSGEKDKPKPLVEKVADANPADDPIGKVTDKKEIVTSAAPEPPPKPVEKPVEKKPDPPKPVEKQAEKKPDPPKPAEKKEEQKPAEKPAEKTPEQKPDPIAEALKKEPSKKPPPKPEAKAAPPQPAKPKQERIFDQSKIAALLDKRDPTRQAITGATLNSTSALGAARGRDADNSATWGAMFKSQVERCWKKPYGGIEKPNLAVDFEIRLRRDGTLEAPPIAKPGDGSPYFRVYQESALRAIIECQPYKLPAQFFDEWKWFMPTFEDRS